jgi:hypothetical protein
VAGKLDRDGVEVSTHEWFFEFEGHLIFNSLGWEVDGECPINVLVGHIWHLASDIVAIWTFGAIELDDGVGHCDGVGGDEEKMLEQHLGGFVWDKMKCVGC